MTTWLDATEAARRLGVQPATLYAYVSRGRLRRRTGPDGRRSEYHAGDLAALAVRGRRARPTQPSDVVLPSSITTITAAGPSYRGVPAVELAGAASFEDVADRLWEATSGPDWTAPEALVEVARDVRRHGPATDPAGRLPSVIAAVRTADPLGHDLEPSVVVATARRLIATMTAVTGADVPAHGPIAVRLAHAIVGGPAADGIVEAIDTALVLLADHELAASTLAVRIAASARCDPYAAVLAGSAVVTGRRHGAASRPLEQVLRDVEGGREPATALAAQRRSERSFPGFGHPLYPSGDPRAVHLIDLLRAGPLHDRCGPLDAVLRAAADHGLPPPNIDAALAGLTLAVGGRPGTGELVFATARTAGWVAHALEQYADPELLRPRAVYTGG